MLRQPQLHSSITRPHMHSRACVCAPHYLQSPTQETHILALHIHYPAVAMGDKGVSARVWHALSQVARENDDSWQHTVWLPPKLSPTPTPCVIRLFLPSPHLYISPHSSPSFSPVPCMLIMASNSSSTCLDSSTFMKSTMWAAFSCVFYLAPAFLLRLTEVVLHIHWNKKTSKIKWKCVTWFTAYNSFKYTGATVLLQLCKHKTLSY